MANPFTYATILAPAATTGPASGVLTSSAIVSGTVGDGGQGAASGVDSSCSFDWGTTPALGNVTSGAPANFTGVGQSVVASLTGLTASTRYYFRVAATNSVGTTYGQTLSFETTTNVPTLLTPAAASQGGPPPGPVTFSWTYNPGGASGGQTGYSLQLTGIVPGESGAGPWYWTGSGWTATVTWISSSAQSVTVPAANLTPNTAYSWTVATEDANGQSGYA